MPAKRIVPCLDVRDRRVVKGLRFRNLVEKGDPAELAHRYAREGADEIGLLKIDAGSGRPLRPELVRSVSRGLDIPLTVGGGIGSVEQADALLAAGADRISLNTLALEHPDVISEAAARFGRQAVVLAVDARSDRRGGFEVYSGGARHATGRDPADWAEEGERRGAGEILLTSIDHDGSREGFDLTLLRHVRRRVAIPIIASGGARDARSFWESFRSGADAALAAGILHDRRTTVRSIKESLARRGVEVRR